MTQRPRSILVTGHSGFLGRHLCLRLREELPGARLTGVSRSAARLPGVRSVRGDACDAALLARALRGARPDWVFHMAGAPASPSWDAMVLGQIRPAAALLAAVAATPEPRPRVIVPGSAAEYGALPRTALPAREDGPMSPVNPYGVAKLAQSELARAFHRRGLDVVVARLFNILGPGLHPSLSISSFTRQIAEIELGRRPPVLETGNLSARRDFLPVEDAARALLAVARRGRSGEAYNICTGRSLAIAEVVAHLLKLARVPIRVVTRAGRLRPMDIPDLPGSYAKLRRLGWAPRGDLDACLAAMLAHDRARLAR